MAGFVPEGRVLIVHLWDPWPSAMLPAERGEVATCPGVLAGPQESLVLLILGNGIDMDVDSGSLGQPVPGRSPCQGLSASANETPLAKPHVPDTGRLARAASPARSLDPPMSPWQCGPVSRSPRQCICWASCSGQRICLHHVLEFCGSPGRWGALTLPGRWRK